MASSFFMQLLSAWRLRSGREWIVRSPWFVRHTKQFSLCAASDLDTKVVKPTLRTLDPSCAVSLYLPHGFSVGRKNVLNCSSELIITLCGPTAASPAAFSATGRPAASTTRMSMTGALCFSWISLPRRAATLSVRRFSPDATERRNTRICPLFVPAQSVHESVCAGGIKQIHKSPWQKVRKGKTHRWRCAFEQS